MPIWESRIAQTGHDAELLRLRLEFWKILRRLLRPRFLSPAGTSMNRLIGGFRFSSSKVGYRPCASWNIRNICMMGAPRPPLANASTNCSKPSPLITSRGKGSPGKESQARRYAAIAVLSSSSAMTLFFHTHYLGVRRNHNGPGPRRKGERVHSTPKEFRLFLSARQAQLPSAFHLSSALLRAYEFRELGITIGL